MLIILIIIAVLGYYYLKENGGLPEQKKDHALDALKERYVNDEITEEEYLRKKKILEE